MSERKAAGYLGKALLIELRPLPMILVILAALFVAVLAHQVVGIKYPTLFIHVANVAVILYSAHLVDTYNDLKKREEYQRGYKRRILFDSHDPEKIIHLNMNHYVYAMICTYLVTIILSGILVVETGLFYIALAFMMISLSVSYSFGLDRIFLLGDLAWELGVILAFKIGLKWSHRLAYILMIIPIILLGFMVPTLHLTLIIPILIALGLVIVSYRYPAEKGIYFVSGAIILFLVWAIIVLI